MFLVSYTIIGHIIGNTTVCSHCCALFIKTKKFEFWKVGRLNLWQVDPSIFNALRKPLLLE